MKRIQYQLCLIYFCMVCTNNSLLYGMNNKNSTNTHLIPTIPAYKFILPAQKELVLPLFIETKIPLLKIENEFNKKQNLGNTQKKPQYIEWDLSGADSPVQSKELLERIFTLALENNNRSPWEIFYCQRFNETITDYQKACDFLCLPDLIDSSITIITKNKENKLPQRIKKRSSSEFIRKNLIRSNFKIFNQLYGLITLEKTIIFTTETKKIKNNIKHKIKFEDQNSSFEICYKKNNPNLAFIYCFCTKQSMPLSKHKNPIISIALDKKNQCIVKTKNEEKHWNLYHYLKKESQISLHAAWLIHILYKTHKPITSTTLDLPTKEVWQSLPQEVQSVLKKKFNKKLHTSLS